MTDRDDSENPRGWSVVFNAKEHTLKQPRALSDGAVPEDDVEREGEAATETVIDKEIAGRLAEELALLPTSTADGPLKELTLRPPSNRGPQFGADALARDGRPGKGRRATVFSETTAPDPGERTKMDVPPIHFTDRSTDRGTEDRAGAPPRGGPGSPEGGETPIEAPAIPARLLAELGPIENLHDVEMTVLDVAAQLGLQPEPLAKPEDARIEGEGHEHKAVSESAAQLRMPAALDPSGAKVAELLEDERSDRPAAFGRPNPTFQRGETLLQHLPRWLFITDSAARVIPFIIAAFVVVSTIAASLMLFRGRSGATEHVTVRFLPTQESGASQVTKTSAPPLLTIETEPEGILVVLDRKILGTTPISFESPVRSARIGIELVSPYYETWIGEAKREDSGAYRLHAKLTRKR